VTDATMALSVKGGRLICLGDTYRNSFTEMRAAIWATMMRVIQVEFLEQEDDVAVAGETMRSPREVQPHVALGAHRR